MSRPRRRCDVGSGAGKGADMTPRDEPIRPMTLGNMYQNGVRGLYVTCSACGHHTELNVDAWPDDVTDRRSARACGAPSAVTSAPPPSPTGGSGRTSCGGHDYRAAEHERVAAFGNEATLRSLRRSPASTMGATGTAP